MKSANNVKTIIEHAEQYCKSHGTRLTTKRKMVLSSLLHSNKALSAYDIIDLCKELFDEKIAPMSMYRILEFLDNEKLVHKLKLINKYIACSNITYQKEHCASQFLICCSCNQVKEITVNQSTMTELQEDVELAGFQLTSSQLEMNCTCNNCL
jgi:Fur family zinc uptake transcriptional regulator